jgi:hypothetical protein
MNRVLATWDIRSGKETLRERHTLPFTASKQSRARVKLGVVNSFSCFHDDNLKGRRNICYGSCSYTYPTVEGFLPGCASASLCSLDKTASFLIAARIARRSEQKQVPTHSGKRSFTKASHHSQSTGETTSLSQGGSITSRLATGWSTHGDRPFLLCNQTRFCVGIVSSFVWSGSAGLRSLRVRRS